MRIVNRVFSLIGLASPRHKVPLGSCIRPKPPHIKLPHILTRATLHNPLRSMSARTTTEDNSETAKARKYVESSQAGNLSHDALAVRRVGIWTIDDPSHTQPLH